MASTSDEIKGFDPKEQVTPFFNMTQLYAFSKAPSADALGRVNRGGSHDYLPQEYVRALLDRFIGPGRWALRATLVRVIDEKIQKGGKENIAVTAIVNVELDILSRIDPNQRLTHAGIGTHTMEAAADKGIAAAVGNAIASAESKGLKAAAKNLGRAFGSDLKNKLNRDTLPPTLEQYARELIERHARKQATHQQDPSNAAPAEQLVEAKAPAEVARPTETTNSNGPSQEGARQTVNDSGSGSVSSRSPAEADAETQPKVQRQPQQRQQRQPKADDGAQNNGAEDATPVDGPKAKSETASNEGGAPAEQAPASQQDADWEMSIMPSDFSEWVSCIRTISARINAMKLEAEIQNFIRRNKKTIAALPIIPGENGKPPRNFQARFAKIVRERYEALGLEVPEQYQARVDGAVAQAA